MDKTKRQDYERLIEMLIEVQKAVGTEIVCTLLINSVGEIKFIQAYDRKMALDIDNSKDEDSEFPQETQDLQKNHLLHIDNDYIR